MLLSGTVGSYSKYNFLRNCPTFPKWLCHFIFLLTIYEGSICSTSSPAFSIVSLKKNFFCHLIVVSHCDWYCCVSFYVLICHQFMLGKVPAQIFGHFFYWVVFVTELWEFFTLDTSPLLQMYIGNLHMSSQNLGLIFSFFKSIFWARCGGSCHMACLN